MSNLLLRRRMLMQAGGSPTPPTPPIPYQRVEYLESTRTQYIDTGIIPDSEYTIECEFMLGGTLSGRNSHVIFGCGIGWNDTNIELYTAWLYANKLSVHYDGEQDVGNYTADVFYKIVQNKGDIIIYNNDNSINATANFGTKTFTCPYTMILFGSQRASAFFSSQPVAIKRFKMIDGNDNIVCDYYPVRVGTTGYMYDTVSGNLFGNAGTGDFIIGPDIN